MTRIIVESTLTLSLAVLVLIGWIAMYNLSLPKEVICDNVERVNESLGVDTYQCGNVRVVILD